MATAQQPSYVAKAGWLFRQSSLLHLWKKKYFTLSVTGQLHYYDSDHDITPEGTLMINQNIRLSIGAQCVSVSPPEGLSVAFLIKVSTNSKEWQLCGTDASATTAWQLSLEQAMNLQFHRPNSAPPIHQGPNVQVMSPQVTYVQQGLGGFPGQQSIYYGSNPYLTQTQPGTSVVYVNPYQYGYRHGYGCDSYGYSCQGTWNTSYTVLNLPK